MCIRDRCLGGSSRDYILKLDRKMSFWELKLRDLGEWTFRNFKIRQLPASTSKAVHAYRAKYITCKNARILPFFHCVGVVMLLNYMMEFKHLRKHEAFRKYH